MGIRLAAAAALWLALVAPDASAEAGAWTESGRRAVARAKQLAPQPGPARNLVLFIGDGMSLTTVTAARILDGQLRGETGEENQLSFDRLPHVALTKTYNTNQQTGDSAATMTAVVTGEKTRAGVLSVDESVEPGDAAGVEGHRLRTIFEQAEERGLATGIVATARLTHATPAACYAHSPARSWESDAMLPERAREAGFPDIARQLVEFSYGDGLEVALGGGAAMFLPRERDGQRQDGRDLTQEWVARAPKSAVVFDRAGLMRVDAAKTDHLLGLFAPSHLAYEAERKRKSPPEPSLSEMTARSIEILSRNPRGFILMVEGGRIDHAHHQGNAARALIDTIELSRAVQTALDATQQTDTLVVVTADHGHVMTMGGYATRGNDILGLVHQNDPKGQRNSEPAQDALGQPFTVIGYANGPGYTGASEESPEGPKRFPHTGRGYRGIEKGRPDLTKVDTTDLDFLQEAAVPFSSETHSGEDVPVYAGGPGAHLFHGVQEQSYLYHAMVEALGWNQPRPPASDRGR